MTALVAGFVLLVGVHDVLDDLVAHDVVRVELDEREVVDTVEDAADRQQARAAASFGEVDLGDVTGHDDLRPEAEPGEEHLHLLGRGVLRFVEDDERVVQRAAAHERERRHFDRASLHEPRHDLGIEHVVERVVERAEIGIDLGEDVAGQEAESLPRFDRGPREDDPVDLLRLQCLHRERDREVALAGARRPDPERDRVGAHRVDVALLTRGLGMHRLPAAQDLGVQHLARALVGLQHVDAATDALAVERVTGLEQRDELAEEPADALDLDLVAGDGDLVAAHVDRDGERGFHQAEQLVALAEQADHEVVARDEDLDLGRRRYWHVEVRVAAAVARRNDGTGRTGGTASQPALARRPSWSSRVPRSSGLRPITAARTRRSSWRMVSI